MVSNDWNRREAARFRAGCRKISEKLYQLTFIVRELESERVIKTRSYSIIMRSDTEPGSVRAGEKVPYTSITGANNTQWEQIDVGINIECRRLEEMGDRLLLSLTADISSFIDYRQENSPSSTQPIIRNNRWDSTVVVPLKQPTTLFSSDDPASKRKMQLQLTVIPLH